MKRKDWRLPEIVDFLFPWIRVGRERRFSAMNLTSIISIILGLTAGILSAIVISKYQAIEGNKPGNPPIEHPDPVETGAQTVYFVLPERTKQIAKDQFPAGSLAEAVNRNSNYGMLDPRLNSTFLYDRVKVLCFVILLPNQVHNYGKSAKATWTKRCNRILVLGNKYNADVGVIDISLPDGKYNSWSRSKLALQYVYDNFKDDEFDWFVKVSYDSLIVVENLRYLLLMHHANIPNYIAHVFSGPKSEGSVFAVSKQGLALIAPHLQGNKPAYGGMADDLELEECFKVAGALPRTNGKDAEGVRRFRMIVPDHKLPMNTKGFTAWYWQYIRYPEKKVM